MTPTLFIVALLAVWGLVVAWSMRRAVRTTDIDAKRRRAQQLLFFVSLGIPLVLALIVIV
jgi:predicted membrane channel-forming protein YqfA (hemolysin III family)